MVTQCCESKTLLQEHAVNQRVLSRHMITYGCEPNHCPLITLPARCLQTVKSSTNELMLLPVLTSLVCFAYRRFQMLLYPTHLSKSSSENTQEVLLERPHASADMLQQPCSHYKQWSHVPQNDTYLESVTVTPDAVPCIF